MADAKWAVVVHGGCKPIKVADAAGHRAGLHAALSKAVSILSSGGRALDAVEAAVCVLEDDPTFNAGKGSATNADGEVEMDAAIMDGSTLQVGAVCALKDTSNPIRVARRLVPEEEMLLAGDGAFRFAEMHGLAKRGLGKTLTEGGGGVDTVGCVALDLHGDVAAATSTGGLQGSKPGRVGDSPAPGLGVYADNRSGAISATGEGESIARVLLGARAVVAMEAGLPPDEAVKTALAHMSRVPGQAALIAVDMTGRIGWNRTGDQLAIAWADSADGAFHIEIAGLDEAEDA